MITVKGVFDGQSVKLLEPPPSTRAASVIVTFLVDEGEAVDALLKEETAEYWARPARSDFDPATTGGVAVADIVSKARLVLDANGQPVAAQIDIAEWSALMGWLEDVEDIQLMRERFRERSERAVTKWEDFEAELKADGLL